MSKLRIGMVDLDTSHPSSFLPIIRELGHEVAGVFDSGTIYPAGYADEFAAKHGIPHVYTTLEDMAEKIDLAIIHSCNWDVHVDRARPFIASGKGVFIDKPLAGNLRDLQQFLEWDKQGARIGGGSALRYCYEVQEWLKNNNAQEDWVYGYAGCGVDEYNYGIHAYSLLHGLIGSGIESARYLGTNVQDQMELVWADGRRGIVSVGKNDFQLPFYATAVTRKSLSQFQALNKQLYRAMLETVLPYFAGETEAPVALETLIESELSAIAAKISRENGGERVLIRDIPVDYPGYDGAEFAAGYRKQKGF